MLCPVLSDDCNNARNNGWEAKPLIFHNQILNQGLPLVREAQKNFRDMGIWTLESSLTMAVPILYVYVVHTDNIIFFSVFWQYISLWKWCAYVWNWLGDFCLYLLYCAGCWNALQCKEATMRGRGNCASHSSVRISLNHCIFINNPKTRNVGQIFGVDGFHQHYSLPAPGWPGPGEAWSEVLYRKRIVVND